MDRKVVLKISNGMRIDAKANCDLVLKPGDKSIFRKDFYCDLGEVLRTGDELGENEGGDLPTVLQLASDSDLAAANENEIRNKAAVKTTGDLVKQLGLEMKLLNAHYSMDSKLIIIQFTADGRVDFRELVKELSRALGCRIELRQIGVRDETGIFGGISVCGQVMCCSRFLREFNSINVKMAKEQDLSLTPATISGVCGRLKCCLKYEYEGYLELAKTMPRKGEWCETPQGKGRIVDRNLLSQKVMVQLESGNISQFKRDEITIQTFVPGDRRGDRRNEREGAGENDERRGDRRNEQRNERNEQRNERNERRNREERRNRDERRKRMENNAAEQPTGLSDEQVRSEALAAAAEQEVSMAEEKSNTVKNAGENTTEA